MVTQQRLLPGAIPLCRIVLGLCLCASLSSAQSAPTLAPYKWAPVRIVGGGYIASLIAHPKQSGLIYTRTTGGGVYRWNPTTQEWIPLLDFLLGSDNALMGPESVALDPTDPRGCTSQRAPAAQSRRCWFPPTRAPASPSIEIRVSRWPLTATGQTPASAWR